MCLEGRTTIIFAGISRLAKKKKTDAKETVRGGESLL